MTLDHRLLTRAPGTEPADHDTPARIADLLAQVPRHRFLPHTYWDEARTRHDRIQRHGRVAARRTPA
ncbi:MULTISPECIES: hypothetical protein [unclassified Nocardiopsis]|uniref:hypothetical protein n=1 Tax=Nocardiopsis TaxID=2013 RepID=UPI00387AA481